jgi:3-mercaptopyruvate sulfurtransferase SseA
MCPWTIFSSWGRTLKTDLIFLGLMVLGCLSLGLGLNLMRERPLPLYYQSKGERLEESVIPFMTEGRPLSGEGEMRSQGHLSLEEFRVFVEEKKGLILDARPELFYRLGHVPGALSLPREDFAKAYAQLKHRLEADKSQALVLYCADLSCEDSHLLRAALLKLGYREVRLFSGGWAEWTQARLPQEKNP